MVPHVSKELLDYLRQLFPDKAPNIFEDERTIWANVGAVNVVKHLTMLHEEQVERQLGNN